MASFPPQQRAPRGDVPFRGHPRGASARSARGSPGEAPARMAAAPRVGFQHKTPQICPERGQRAGSPGWPPKATHGLRHRGGLHQNVGAVPCSTTRLHVWPHGDALHPKGAAHHGIEERNVFHLDVPTRRTNFQISRQAEFLLPGSPPHPGAETLAVFAPSPNEGSTSTPTRAKKKKTPSGAQAHLHFSLKFLPRRPPCRRGAWMRPEKIQPIAKTRRSGCLCRAPSAFPTPPVILILSCASPTLSSSSKKRGPKADGRGFVLIHHHMYPASCGMREAAGGGRRSSWKRRWGLHPKLAPGLCRGYKGGWEPSPGARQWHHPMVGLWGAVGAVGCCRSGDGGQVGVMGGRRSPAEIGLVGDFARSWPVLHQSSTP